MQDLLSKPSAAHWDDQGQLEVLTFDLGEETLAIEAMVVREILDLLPETKVPGAPPLVNSVVNFRGKIIPIADLRLAFGMPAATASVDSRIIVIEIDIDGEPTQIGMRTDKVHEVTTLHQRDAEPAPSVGIRWRREFIHELVRQAGGIIVLPDLAAIFTHCSAASSIALATPSI
jgi:purine-binding chemotaxis protein CheW